MEEFRYAIFLMHPDKCPDGYNSGFYQHFWSSCSEDIFKDCCEWLETGQFTASLNSSNITLIPKGNIQTIMKDWRPMTLCNVLYKFISCLVFKRTHIMQHKLTHVDIQRDLIHAT